MKLMNSSVADEAEVFREKIENFYSCINAVKKLRHCNPDCL
jgi:hypothetical protein